MTYVEQETRVDIEFLCCKMPDLLNTYLKTNSSAERFFVCLISTRIERKKYVARVLLFSANKQTKKVLASKFFRYMSINQAFNFAVTFTLACNVFSCSNQQTQGKKYVWLIFRRNSLHWSSTLTFIKMTSAFFG